MEPTQGRILIVEDDADSRGALARLLGMQGYQVIAAESVASALREIAHHPRFDILLSDLQLPDGTGWELLKMIPAARLPPSAVALSGSFGENESVRSHNCGFCAHLTKPITFDRLLDVLEQCTSGSR